MKLTLDSQVGLLLLPIRVARAVEAAKCETIREVVSHPAEFWLNRRNFGKVSLRKLKEAIARHDLQAPPLPEPEPPPPPEPETKIRVPMTPETGHHAEQLKLDEVMDLCVKFVRSIQLLRQAKSQEAAKKCLRYERQLKRHFPSLTRSEAVRLANLVVHAGSLSFRHAMGMKVVLPQKIEMERVQSKGPKTFWFVMKEGETEKTSLDDAMIQAAQEEKLGRFMVADIFDHLRQRGWMLDRRLGLTHVRYALKRSPSFRQCSPKGAYRLFFRFLPGQPPLKVPEYARR